MLNTFLDHLVRQALSQSFSRMVRGAAMAEENLTSRFGFTTDAPRLN